MIAILTCIQSSHPVIGEDITVILNYGLQLEFLHFLTGSQNKLAVLLNPCQLYHLKTITITLLVGFNVAVLIS